MTYRLLVIACSARKKAGPEWLEAIERYDGPLWQSVRAHPVPDNVAIMAMSARYGLFRSWLTIPMYDERMTDELADEVLKGARGRYMPDWKMPVNELRDAREALRLRFGTRYAELFSDVCLVGSPVYLRVMLPYVRYYAMAKGQQCISPDATLTVATGMIGYMRKDMKDWIRESPHVSRTKLIDFRARNREDSPIETPEARS